MALSAPAAKLEDGLLMDVHRFALDNLYLAVIRVI